MAKNTIPTTPSILDQRYENMNSDDLFITINENLTTLRAILNSEDLFDITGIGLSNFIAHTQDLVNMAEQRTTNP